VATSEGLVAVYEEAGVPIPSGSNNRQEPVDVLARRDLDNPTIVFMPGRRRATANRLEAERDAAGFGPGRPASRFAGIVSSSGIGGGWPDGTGRAIEALRFPAMAMGRGDDRDPTREM
jgi:hypothetical protein